jgi:hypothetical protein
MSAHWRGNSLNIFTDVIEVSCTKRLGEMFADLTPLLNTKRCAILSLVHYWEYSQSYHVPAIWGDANYTGFS